MNVVLNKSVRHQNVAVMKIVVKIMSVKGGVALITGVMHVPRMKIVPWA